MNAGELRHVVTILTPSGTRAANGEQVTTWTATATNVAAGIRPASSREMLIAGAVQRQVTHTITIRHRAGVTTDCRVTLGARSFDVAGVVNVDERNDELRLLCYETGATS